MSAADTLRDTRGASHVPSGTTARVLDALVTAEAPLDEQSLAERAGATRAGHAQERREERGERLLDVQFETFYREKGLVLLTTPTETP
jgi:hypothetical protein